MLAVGFSHIAFIMLRYDPSILTLLWIFIINGCWIMSNAFSACIDMIRWFLSFILFMCQITLFHDPEIPLLGIYSKKPKTLIPKNIRTLMLITALFTIARMWKHPKCLSVDEWLKQLWDIYTMEYYSVIKKNKILSFITAWMDLENIMLSEMRQSRKDKYHMISLKCGT